MKFAPHWARIRVDLEGQVTDDGAVTAFGWSRTSQEDALLHAHDRAVRLAGQLKRLMNGDDVELGDEAEYYCVGDRPMREPIVEEHRASGTLTAAITRNGYGCYVLNTTGVAFIDIDLAAPPPRPKQPGFFARLFGAKPAPVPSRAEFDKPVRARIEAVMSKHPDVGLRLYRTAMGFRGVVTHRSYRHDDPEIHALMTELGSDPLYMRLCKIQECFRARLTPKPWRIGLPAAPHGFYPTPAEQRRVRDFTEWEARYNEERGAFSVCERVDHFGPSVLHSDVAALLELHDSWVLGTGPMA